MKRFLHVLIGVGLILGFTHSALAYVFTQDLQLWDTGTEVAQLQQYLNAHGYPVAKEGPGSVGNETTTFGTGTYRAVKNFQVGHNITDTGYVGPLTRAALNGTSSAVQSGGASNLTAGQIDAIISLLQSFGADQATMQQVKVALGTAPQTGSSGSIASSTTATSTCPAASCIPGTNIIQPLAPSGGYTPGFGGGGTTVTTQTQSTPTPDTTAPTVSITAPTNSSTVYGSSVTLSASASDDVAVAGVTFKVNGVIIGSEDTTSPYSVTWDSTATSSGSKTVVAVARDTSGNLATSSAVTITNMNVVSTGALIGILGDSINEFEFNAGATQSTRQTGLQMLTGGTGEVGDALAYDPRASLLAWNDLTDNTALLTNTPRYYSGGDVARAGAGLLDIYNEISRVTSYAPDVVIIGGGTNSLALSDSAFVASSTAIWDAVHSALPNAVIGVENVRPVAISASTTGSRTTTNIQAKNTALAAALASRPWADLIDVYSQYNDDPVNSGYGLSTNYGDGLHPSIVGALKGSAPIKTFIQNHVTSGNAITARKLSSVLPTGYALNTGSHSISHISGNGGGVAGTAPTWADVAISSGNPVSSTTVSLESNSETGGQTIVLTVTPNNSTSTSEGFVIRPTGINFATTSLQSQWVRMWAELECDQGPWIKATLNNAERSNSTNNLQQAIVGIASTSLSAGTRRIYPITPNLQFPATSTGATPSITITFNPSVVTSSFTCKLRQWDMQTENSPVRP